MIVPVAVASVIRPVDAFIKGSLPMPAMLSRPHSASAPIGASYVLSPGTAKNRRSLLRHGHRGMIGQTDQLCRALGIHNDNRSGGTSHGQQADGSEEGQLTAKWPGTGNG